MSGAVADITVSPRRAAKREANRLRILAVATDLFFERGYAGTTMAQICEALEATKPFVYWYFKDKQAILDTIAIEAAALIVNSLDDLPSELSAAGQLREGLRRLAVNNVRWFRSNSFYSREPGALGKEARERIRAMAGDFHRKFVQLIERAVAEGALPAQDARISALGVAGVVGFMYTWYRADGRLSHEQVAGQLLVLMLRALGMTTL